MSSRIGSSVGGTKTISREGELQPTEIDVADEGLLVIGSSRLRLEVDRLCPPVVDFWEVAPGYRGIQYYTRSCLK